MARPRLLLVDDEPTLADFLARAAAECGFDAEVTGDDREFRDSFIKNRPEIVALDLGMPGWDPLESTCRHASLSIL